MSPQHQAGGLLYGLRRRVMRRQLAAEHSGNEQLHLMKAAMLWGNLTGFGSEFCSSCPCVTGYGLFSSSDVSVLRPWDFREAGGPGSLS